MNAMNMLAVWSALRILVGCATTYLPVVVNHSVDDRRQSCPAGNLSSLQASQNTGLA